MISSTTTTTNDEKGSNNNEEKEIATELIELDVSSSYLGDAGLTIVMKALQDVLLPLKQQQQQKEEEQEEEEGRKNMEVHLSARMNRLTASGAATLFDNLIQMGQRQQNQYEKEEEEMEKEEEKIDSINNATTSASAIVADDENKGEEKVETDDTEESPPMSKSFSPEMYVSYLDIGLNDLSGGGSGSSSSIEQKRAFGKSLRRLIEGEVIIEDTTTEEKNNDDSKKKKDDTLQSSYCICPRILRMDSCCLGPTACRSIGKGLLNRSKQISAAAAAASTRKNMPFIGKQLSILHLSGNEHIGDAGAAAMAAALRTAILHPRSTYDDNNPYGGDDGSTIKKTTTLLFPVLEHLNLSACNVGDAGVEALALAIRDNKGCLLGLDLSGNKIGDDGVMALAEALIDASVSSKHNNKGKKGDKNDTTTGAETAETPVTKNTLIVKEMENLDLSGNHGVGNDGATAIASAFEKGKIKDLVLRSCSVQADGAAAFGKAIISLAEMIRKSSDDNEEAEDIGAEYLVPTYNIDLSGNLFGTVRIEKKKKGFNKHAEKLLKSKASAKVASQMNFLGRKIQSGLKDAGLDVSPFMEGFAPSAESDDDEEELMRMAGGIAETEDDARAGAARSSAPRCGARSFADPIVDFDLDGKKDKGDQKKRKILIRCRVGMRRCSLDAGAADALAAAVLHARDYWRVDLTFDTSMNSAMIGEDSMAALSGAWEMLDSDGYGCWRRDAAREILLKEMAERHLDVLKQLAQARKRAMEAAEAAAARARAEAAFGSAWETDDEDRGEYDSYDEFGDAPIGGGWDYGDDNDHYDDQYGNFEEDY